MASLFLALTPVVAYVHCKRYFRKGPADWIAWSHFAAFAVFLFVAVRMLRRWITPMAQSKHPDHDDLAASASADPFAHHIQRPHL